MSEDFHRQIAILEEAAGVVETMVKQLRGGMDVEKARGMNDRLQNLEGEADKLVLRMLQAFYKGERDTREVFVFKDVFELIEKAIDRCRDAGNTTFYNGRGRDQAAERRQMGRRRTHRLSLGADPASDGDRRLRRVPLALTQVEPSN